MKKCISFFIVLLILLMSSACLSVQNTSLDEPLKLDASGAVSAQTLNELKTKNKIGCFYDFSNNCRYEWTIFGSDIKEVQDIVLLANIEKNNDGLRVDFSSDVKLDFPIVLSINTGEKWDALNAAVYILKDDKRDELTSASLTGTNETVINFTLTDLSNTLLIVPNYELEPDDLTPSPTLLPSETNASDEYLSAYVESDSRVYSDGKSTNQDQYLTDPVPEGKPLPVEPDNMETNKNKAYTCTFSIECSTLLSNLSELDPTKLEMVPSSGIILSKRTVTFYDGESVFDVLKRVCKENGIHLEAAWTPIYNSAYIEGINNIYEFDCGSLSGWMYRVNGWYPNYGSSRYRLAQGDNVEWRYTCDLGKDIGGGFTQ